MIIDKTKLLVIISLLAFCFTGNPILAQTRHAAAPGQIEIKASWITKKKKSTIVATKKDKAVYISLKSLAKFLEAVYEPNIEGGKGNLKFKNGMISFNQFSPYVTMGDKSYNIRRDIMFYYGDFYAPAASMIEVIGRLVPEEMAFSENDLSLMIYPARYNVVDFAVQQKINGLLIEIFLSQQLKYDIVKTIDSWMIVNIYNGKIDTSAFKRRKPASTVIETKAYQFDKSAQVSIRLRGTDFNYVHKYKDDPPRIQIAVKGDAFADTVLTYTPPESLAAPAKIQDTLIDVIVIDPGHGGDDNGAIGPSKTKEKDIVLDIAKKLRDILERSDFKVILTRDDDRFIPLGDRTDIANEAEADLFVSIHCNAASNKKANGTIAFFLADAKSDQARAAAALENSVIKFESPEDNNGKSNDIGFILSDMMQNEYLKESADLADMIQKSIKNKLKIESRGVDQAGFFVLNKAFMPSVLVETAFISNKNDEKTLRDSKKRQAIAEAISESILQFKDRYEGMK
jgi:N-acetylmuramoyl-L-alanine amidase